MYLQGIRKITLPQISILGVLCLERIALDFIGTKDALHFADGIIDCVVLLQLLGIVTCMAGNKADYSML